MEDHLKIFKKDKPVIINASFKYGGFGSHPLTHEKVFVSYRNMNDMEWHSIGTGPYETDGHGKLSIAFQPDKPGRYEICTRVEGDNSFEICHVRLVDPKANKLAVFDLDGTATASGEIVQALFHYLPFLGIKPKRRDDIEKLAAKLEGLGYTVVYLSACSAYMRNGRVAWLDDNALPRGVVHTFQSWWSWIYVPGHSDFKQEYIKGLIDEGFEFAVGYGNKASDFEAYHKAAKYQQCAQTPKMGDPHVRFFGKHSSILKYDSRFHSNPTEELGWTFR